MARQHLQPGVDRGADPLGDAEHGAAEQRAPEVAETPDDDGLEAEQEAARPRDRIEIAVAAHQHARETGDREGQRRRDGVDLAVVDAHQADGRGIVGGRAHRGPQPGAIEEGLDAADEHDREAEHAERVVADRETGQEAKARGRGVAHGQFPAVGAEDELQGVLDHDGQTEGDEQRRQQIPPQGPVEHQTLQPVADGRHQRQDDEQRRAQGSPACCISGKARKAASTMMSPWARLTMRMTPNMSDRPVAKSA